MITIFSFNAKFSKLISTNTGLKPALITETTSEFHVKGGNIIFEGTPKQMYESLSKLSVLDRSTKIYCTHEYTQSNLNFAVKVEPYNNILVEYKNKIDEKRLKNEISLPTNLKLEKDINPFLRSHVLEIKENIKDFAKINHPTDLETFTAVRSLKDNS